MEIKRVKITNISNETKKYSIVNLNIDKEKKYFYYIENDSEKTVNIYDYENNILKRDNNKLYLELKFIPNKKTINKLELKELNNSLYLEVFTKELDIKKDRFIISYIQNNEEYLYKIEEIQEDVE